MKEVIVLGSGCARCTRTAELIESTAHDCGVSVHVVKETNPEVIMKLGVMSTPAVVINDKLVHSGSIPDTEKVRQWLKN